MFTARRRGVLYDENPKEKWFGNRLSELVLFELKLNIDDYSDKVCTLSKFEEY
jgi:hypothetical protein